MVNNVESNIDPKLERENAYQAVNEFVTNGSTNRRYLRCQGRLIIFVKGDSYQVKCERENCFILTSRGI